MKYSVKVSREDEHWLATVTNLSGAHTYAESRAQLKDNVVEVIRLVQDLSDDAELDIEYLYDESVLQDH